MSAANGCDGNLIFSPHGPGGQGKWREFSKLISEQTAPCRRLVQKLTFVKHFPDWAWVIGTGIYLDSVEREVETKNQELVKNLRNRLTNTRIGDTGYIYIFDSDGNMIIHPNSNIEGTNFIKLANPGKGSFIFDDLVAAYQSGEKVLYYKWDKPTDKGNYVYDKVSWIDYNKDFDWYICSSAYIAEINSTAGRLKKYLWLTSFIMLLMVLCIGAVYFKRLLKPIEILSLQAARVQEGKLSVRNRIRGSSEIGTLAQTFDNMLDTIQDNINFLDKKVSERTRDLQETVKKLDFLASYDPMTGIYNRRKFFELAASRFDEDRDDLYAAMMDIDKFKKINDTYGHAIGDLMLSAVAATIKKQLKEDALFGRLGGEEFAIISHYASWREMETHIEQIRESIEKMEIQTENGDIIRCTISTGVAKKEHTLKDLDEFLNRADEFMYRAKGMGRNRTIFRVSD
ncbi:MAG: diguanylate cyclase, partial [Desulfobacterales bacterium]